MPLQELRNNLVVYREITIVKDNQSELGPRPRKHMITRTAVIHRINKEAPSLKNFGRPLLLNQKLALNGTHCIHPDMFLDSLMTVQDSIVTQPLEKLSCHGEHGLRRNPQSLHIICAWRAYRNPLKDGAKLFKEEQIVFLCITGWLWATETCGRRTANLRNKRSWICLKGKINDF